MINQNQKCLSFYCCIHVWRSTSFIVIRRSGSGSNILEIKSLHPSDSSTGKVTVGCFPPAASTHLRIIGSKGNWAVSRVYSTTPRHHVSILRPENFLYKAEEIVNIEIWSFSYLISPQVRNILQILLFSLSHHSCQCRNHIVQNLSASQSVHRGIS